MLPVAELSARLHSKPSHASHVGQDADSFLIDHWQLVALTGSSAVVAAASGLRPVAHNIGMQGMSSAGHAWRLVATVAKWHACGSSLWLMLFTAQRFNAQVSNPSASATIASALDHLQK